MNFTLEGPLFIQSSLCAPLLRGLPDWFGIEEAIRQYEQEIGHLPTFLATADKDLLGFLSLKQHSPYSVEIYVMAVRLESQRVGIGHALVGAAEAYARGLGVEYMQVKTLGPSRIYEPYARTRAFYQAMGFRPLEEFTQVWGKSNPCLVMVKRL